MAATATKYHVVQKSDRGYEMACSFSFDTVADADAWRRKNLRGPSLIATRVPADVGHGWKTLNADDIVAASES